MCLSYQSACHPWQGSNLQQSGANCLESSLSQAFALLCMPNSNCKKSFQTCILFDRKSSGQDPRATTDSADRKPLTDILNASARCHIIQHFVGLLCLSQVAEGISYCPQKASLKGGSAKNLPNSFALLVPVATSAAHSEKPVQNDN